jgi:hypothetical protein
VKNKMKFKKGEITIIGIAVFVILGAVALSMSDSITSDTTSTTAITDQNFTASNTSCVTLTSRCILTKGTFENTSNGVAIGGNNWTMCGQSGTYYTGVLLDGDGATEVLYQGVQINTSYTEIACNYVNNSFVTTILPYVIILLAALVFMSVALWTQNQ